MVVRNRAISMMGRGFVVERFGSTTA